MNRRTSKEKYVSKYTHYQRYQFWWEKTKCQANERYSSAKYERCELRYRLRLYVKLSAQLREKYEHLVISSGGAVIYALNGCGMNYIGQTNDPWQRFVQHLTGNDDCSSCRIVDACIDNDVMPTLEILEILDVCPKKMKHVCEGIWMTAIPNCVNVIRNKNSLPPFDYQV